uniref:hypothetical protein n=1 Tax=uncultured Mucilaginibacter sp. TaxID=797541 RepID=UPI0025CFD9A9
TLIVTAGFAFSVNAQGLKQQPKLFNADTLHNADSSLLSHYLKHNPNLFKAQPMDTVTANIDRLVVYSTMPVAHIGQSADRMPVDHLSSSDKMPVKKVEVQRPFNKLTP